MATPEEDKNLSSLFDSLNMISSTMASGTRPGGATGGGTQQFEGNQAPNPLIGLNPYLGKNVTSFNKGGNYRPTYSHGGTHRQLTFQEIFGGANFDKGGKLTPAEYKKVQKLGRNGDTQLAHINPQEAQILKAMGGSGTINPYTGLPEYGWFSDFVDTIGDAIGGAMGAVHDVVSPVITPIFDAAGNVVETVGEEVVEPIVTEVGDTAFETIGTGLEIGRDVLEGGADAIASGFEAVATPFAEGMEYVWDYINSLLGGGEDPKLEFTTSEMADEKRRAQEKTEQASSAPKLRFQPYAQKSGLGQEKTAAAPEGDWVSDKPNPFTTPNVEEELDYAAKGMKYNYYGGGRTNKYKYDEGGVAGLPPVPPQSPQLPMPDPQMPASPDVELGLMAKSFNNAIALNQISSLLKKQLNDAIQITTFQHNVPPIMPNPVDIELRQPSKWHYKKGSKRFTQGGKF